MDAKLEAIAKRLESAVERLEKCGTGGAAPAGDDDFEDYPQVTAYDASFKDKMNDFLGAAKAIDQEIFEMSEFVYNGFTEVRRLVLLGARANKPDDVTAVFKPLIDVKTAGLKWCNDHYRTKWVNHEKAIHEFYTILDWVGLGPSAGNFVVEITGAVQCYTNKIAMEFRGKDENQMKWVQSLVAALKALPDYINDYHKMGLSWNARAPKATAPAKMKGASDAPAAAAAPAPAPAADKPAAPSANALAAALAKRQGGGAAPAAAAKPGPAAAKPAPAKKDPIIRRPRPNLIQIEEYDGTDPVLDNLDIKDILNFYKCKNCTLKVESKVKALAFQNCERVTLLIGDVVGMVEITACKRAVIYMNGACKSMTVDKCDNVQINVNEASIDLQVVLAQSVGVNIDVPDLQEEGNMIEFPVPEQILVKLADRKLVHEVYVHE